MNGYYKPLTPREEPNSFVKFTLRWRKYRVWRVPLEALVDTGSPFTALSPRDTVRLQIPLSRLDRHPELISIAFGGLDFIPRLAKGAEFIFKDKDGGEHEIKHEPIYALEPTTLRSKWEERGAFRFPNVIGMDLLRKWRVKLHLDPCLDEFALEFREEE